MRTLSKTMIGLLVAATSLTPLAAEAQDRGSYGGRGGDRADRGDRGNDGNRNPGVQDRGPSEQRQQAAPAAAPTPAPAPAPAPAMREPDRGDRGQRGFGGQRDRATEPSAVGNDGGRAAIQDRGNFQGRQDDRRDGRGDQRFDQRDDRRFDDRRDDRRDWQNGRRDDRRDWQNGRRDDQRGWNREWRGDRRYGWQDYRNQNRNIYRVPRYSAPRGYGYNYRRWSPGYRIDSWFYGQNYWINDPFFYRLPPAYGDYRWVRYYDDVILVDVRTGLIADIIYDFFWR